MGAVLTARPLLLRACEAGAFGSSVRQGESAVHDALFTFLDGPACPELLDARADELPGRQLDGTVRHRLDDLGRSLQSVTM